MRPEPLVSVVTPVYNTGEYLEQAIRSVLSQSYSNWEYIICNNHSTDDSGAIAERYARLDPRIRIVSPPAFITQIPNFNFALQQISPESKYTKIICADDYLLPNCLSEMVALAETDESVAIVSSYRLIEAEGDCFGLPIEHTVIPGRVAGRLHLLNRIFLFGGPSTVMYRSSIVRERSPRFFPEERFFFDTDAAFQVLVDKSFGFVHQICTFTRYQPGSITETVGSFYWRDLDRLLCLHAHGRAYLTPEEFDRAMSRALRVYYEGLGRQWLTDRVRGKNKEFWDFHTKWLTKAGLKIEARRLMLGACAASARAIGSPFDLARDMVRRRRPTERPWNA